MNAARNEEWEKRQRKKTPAAGFGERWTQSGENDKKITDGFL